MKFVSRHAASIRRALCAVGAVFLASPLAPFSPLSAQVTASEPIAAAAAQQRAFCFRGNRLARCRTFAIFEVSGNGRLAGTSRTSETPVGNTVFRQRGQDMFGFVSGQVGLMVNRDSSHAMGAGLRVGGSDGELRVSLEARRRWWHDAYSIDVAAGPMQLTQSVAVPSRRQLYGLTGEVAVGTADLVALTFGADVARGGGHTAAGVRAGVRVGSYSTLLLTAASAVLIALLASAYRD